VTRRIPIDFRQFLVRLQTLFLNLHTWTVRLLVPRRFRRQSSSTKRLFASNSGRPWTRASVRRWRRISASGKSWAGTWASPPIDSSAGSSDGREWRKLRRCIEPGGERETWSCGGRRQRPFATIECTAARPVKYMNSTPNTCSSPRLSTGKPGPRRGQSENRVRLAPRFRRPLTMASHPWWLHDREPRSSASAAATSCARVGAAALCAAVPTGAGVGIA
jgi:hypothetical protein